MLTVGSDYKILNFTLTGAYSNITTLLPFRTALLKALNRNNITIRKSASDTVEFNLDGEALIFETNKIPDSGTTTTICQAKTSAASETLEVILTLY